MADGDGQHKTGDIVKCARELMGSEGGVVLGVRDFRGIGVPKRNSRGNRATALAFRLLFGIKLRDTQTGLRGIPARHMTLLAGIAGARFEYETNMLIELKRLGIPFVEVAIAAVYDDNMVSSSHYRPFADSVKIFARILWYLLSGLLSFFVDIGVFWSVMTFFGNFLGTWSILCATAAARAVSSFFNFNLNRRLVFGRRKGYGRHLLRYYTLASAQMLAAAGLLWLFSLLLGERGAIWLITVLKAAVDAGLFFLGFHIQNRWVFSSRGGAQA